MNAFKTKLLFSGVTFVSPQKKKKKKLTSVEEMHIKCRYLMKWKNKTIKQFNKVRSAFWKNVFIYYMGLLWNTMKSYESLSLILSNFNFRCKKSNNKICIISLLSDVYIINTTMTRKVEI